jgi:hypothetical protein
LKLANFKLFKFPSWTWFKNLSKPRHQLCAKAPTEARCQLFM